MPTTLPLWFSPFVIGVLMGALVMWVWRQTVLEKLKIQLAELKKEQETTQEKLHWAEEAKAHLREAFESLASKALQPLNSDVMH